MTCWVDNHEFYECCCRINFDKKLTDSSETARFLREHQIKPKIEVKFTMKNAVMAHLYKEDPTRRRKGQIVLKNDDV